MPYQLLKYEPRAWLLRTNGPKGPKGAGALLRALWIWCLIFFE